MDIENHLLKKKEKSLMKNEETPIEWDMNLFLRPHQLLRKANSVYSLNRPQSLSIPRTGESSFLIKKSSELTSPVQEYPRFSLQINKNSKSDEAILPLN
ncbi:hypothetical protein HDU92_004392 [Lobulomyces angularis]|nr:hypothetical protein HDU92_004392 [Lobulomyces angularis]